MHNDTVFEPMLPPQNILLTIPAIVQLGPRESARGRDERIRSAGFRERVEAGAGARAVVAGFHEELREERAQGWDGAQDYQEQDFGAAPDHEVRCAVGEIGELGKGLDVVGSQRGA